MVRSALTVQEKAEIWRAYRAGASLRSISRTLGRTMEALRTLVAATGGRPPARTYGPSISRSASARLPASQLPHELLEGSPGRSRRRLRLPRCLRRVATRDDRTNERSRR